MAIFQQGQERGQSAQPGRRGGEPLLSRRLDHDGPGREGLAASADRTPGRGAHHNFLRVRVRGAA